MAPFHGRLPEARAALVRHWGFDAFRPAQLRVLHPLLAGRSVLAVLPTGAGKSLCYQIPALLASGLTLVISPLVSLMQDQVAALGRRGVAAGYLASGLSEDRNRTVLHAALTGALRLLYCAPERLPGLTRRLRATGVVVSLLAVDEAHCVVEWGNEFRPHYRALGKYRYLLGSPITIALTGSATAAARREIIDVLRLRDAHVVVTSFDRPNLRFFVRRVVDDRARFACLKPLVRERDGAALVYAPTRRLTELITRALLLRSIRALPYHAGLTARVRRRVLQAFLQDEVRIVVATTAFGMGIDKPDVRRVVHWGPSYTLEGYYQEAGRAGRDGGDAECWLLWRPADLRWPGIRPAMVRYVRTRRCRRQALLSYFGEQCGGCTGCDRCDAVPVAPVAP